MKMRAIARAVVCLLLLTVGGLLTAQAASAVTTATVSGLVFGDANSNGKADPGEALSGFKVVIGSQTGGSQYTATTSSSGKFSFTVPTDKYYVDGSGGGWYLLQKFVTVPSGGLSLSLRAVKPLGNVLKASMHFTQSTYKPGDTVHLVVTLTNTGSAPLYGITPACNRAGDPDELNNIGAGWGDLRATGPGVALAPNQTRTFTITDKVSTAAFRSGVVAVSCDFGYPGVDQGARPVAGDRAKVPGAFGGLDGDVLSYPSGHGSPGVGLADTRLVLLDPTTCPIFTLTTTTDAKGHFSFTHVPAGNQYKIYIYPPSGWKVTYQDPTTGLVFGNDTTHFGFEVKPGTRTVPNPPTKCTASPSPSSSGTGSGEPPLANTGTHTIGLTLVGAAAVLLGAMVLFGARRRTH